MFKTLSTLLQYAGSSLRNPSSSGNTHEQHSCEKNRQYVLRSEHRPLVFGNDTLRREMVSVTHEVRDVTEPMLSTHRLVATGHDVRLVVVGGRFERGRDRALSQQPCQSEEQPHVRRSTRKHQELRFPFAALMVAGVRSEHGWRSFRRRALVFFGLKGRQSKPTWESMSLSPKKKNIEESESHFSPQPWQMIFVVRLCSVHRVNCERSSHGRSFAASFCFFDLMASLQKAERFSSAQHVLMWATYCL